MDIQRLQLIVTFVCIPAAVYLQSDDISGTVFDPAYYRKIQCAKGVNLSISDDTKSVIVICNETQFDVSLLRECSGYSQFKEIALTNCILPSSDIGETLGDYRPECFFVHSNGSWNYDEIIVRDIPTLTCLALSIKQNVTYVLDNLVSLKSVQIIFLNLTTLPENFFSQLDSLVNIRIQFCEVRFLPETLFRGMQKIAFLYLCCNRLEELPELLFEGLGSLNSIDLSLNRLTSLPANIFKGLINLRNLFLGSNRFKQFPPTLLHDNINLQIINITNNTVSSLPEDFLKASFRLVQFHACYCNITELPDNFFSSSFLLSIISLWYNKIEKLGENLFSKNTWLRILYLNNNRLTSLPANIFASNHRLVGLLLHGNRLNSFANETFRKLSSLQTLTLGENEITNIEEGVFGNLQSLKVINLDNNKIRFLPSKTPLGNLSELLTLSLAGNELTTFPSIDWSVYNLSYLYLDYNRITFLDLDELPPSDHVYVSLLYNNITSVTGPTNSTSLENVKLEGNPFECNCSLKNFADKIQSSGIKSLFCHGPAEYRNTSLADVVPSYVLCPFRTTCPNSCRCYREDTNAIVNCSSSGLIHVPESIPENTSVVRLDHNFVTHFRISSDDWSNVTYLNLDYNRLDPSKSWKIPTSLTYLSLRSNQLDRISKEFLESVDEMPLLRLDIRDNRFWCNCSFAYFKIWFDKNIDRIVEADRVMCSRLYQHNNTKVKSPIISVPLDAFCFLDLPLVNVPLIVSASIVAILALAIISCIVLFMKYKNTVLAYLYVHFPAVFCRKMSEIDGDKLYDAFVSYTASDREVVMSMLRELEEKPPFFRLCIHERDWLPGNPIVSQIEASIQNSRKTVIVLSKEFLESMWCEIEFQMAYLQCLEEKVDRLVIVMVGDIQTRDLLPADMQNLLATKTFLVWGEKWFWEKLKYSLPHYVLPKLPNYQMQTIDRMV
ncbi:protein toll-like [Centruroides vittatus]|uniref:protein toll-like n=1 Tax=Centruroides vittatus TaxID=120091 RepID=UPI00350FBA3F